RIRYANQRAARFGVPPGWAPPDRLARAVMNKESGLVARWEDAAASDSSNVLSRVGNVVQEAWNECRRLVRHLQLKHNGEDFFVTLLSDPIRNWRDQAIGLLVNSQDLTFVYRIFTALYWLHEVPGDEPAARDGVLQTDESETENLIARTFQIFRA